MIPKYAGPDDYCPFDGSKMKYELFNITNYANKDKNMKFARELHIYTCLKCGFEQRYAVGDS